MKFSKKDIKPTPETDLPALVIRCQADGRLLEELAGIYRQADQAVASEVCLAGGACCKFDLFGHRLFVTPAELAMLTVQPPPHPQRAGQGRCPYQIGPTCSAYSRRPLGCRTFFCRSADQSKLQSLHERLHSQIRRLHQSLCLPYNYADLPGQLMQLFLY